MSTAPFDPKVSFSDEKIEALVRTFYGRVRDEPVIGPVFDARIEDWEYHLGRMMMFWRTVLRSEPAYVPGPKGPPPMVHRAIAELERDHFRRWLSLFRDTAAEVFDPVAAELIAARAERMAVHLSAHLPSEAA